MNNKNNINSRAIVASSSGRQDDTINGRE